MKKTAFVAILALSLLVGLNRPAAVWAQDGNAPLSDETQACIDCHQTFTPGIVGDWKSSRHSFTTPQAALQKPELERRISTAEVSEDLAGVAVGCYECHSRAPESHADTFDHFGYQIHVVVTPPDCATCHPVEKEQYVNSKMGNAVVNLTKNAVYSTLVDTLTSVYTVDGLKLNKGESSHAAKATSCLGCHGTVVEVDGMKDRDTALGPISVPNLTNWPSQGVGRINPDGSQGACTACHPRHSFSIEIARKPFTCAQCHLDPDVPAWNVYRESKHGNIMQSVGEQWNWSNVPWVVGQDFKGPSCATCHNSLLTSPDGAVIAERTHDFSDRLYVRLFGLIYATPQPKSGATHIIKNKDGLPLPATFINEPAAEFLIDADEQEARKGKMQAVCKACHSTSWTDGHFDRLDHTVKETNQMTLAATQLMQQGWDAGVADPAIPFDEALEQLWIRQWLFYGTSTRYGAAMGGPDYAAFENGWNDLTDNLHVMKDQIELLEGLEKKEQ